MQRLARFFMVNWPGLTCTFDTLGEYIEYRILIAEDYGDSARLANWEQNAGEEQAFPLDSGGRRLPAGRNVGPCRLRSLLQFVGDEFQRERRSVDQAEQLGEAYRRCCTSVSWVGEALTIHLMHAESVWNYPAFFDYVDRWMTEGDAQDVADIKAQSGFDYSADWDRQGQTRYWLQGEFPQYTFIDDMWKTYR